jgi:hypothetical protein
MADEDLPFLVESMAKADRAMAALVLGQADENTTDAELEDHFQIMGLHASRRMQFEEIGRLIRLALSAGGTLDDVTVVVQTWERSDPCRMWVLYYDTTLSDLDSRITQAARSIPLAGHSTHTPWGHPEFHTKRIRYRRIATLVWLLCCNIGTDFAPLLRAAFRRPEAMELFTGKAARAGSLCSRFLTDHQEESSHEGGWSVASNIHRRMLDVKMEWFNTEFHAFVRAAKAAQTAVATQRVEPEMDRLMRMMSLAPGMSAQTAAIHGRIGGMLFDAGEGSSAVGPLLLGGKSRSAEQLMAQAASTYLGTERSKDVARDEAYRRRLAEHGMHPRGKEEEEEGNKRQKKTRARFTLGHH